MIVAIHQPEHLPWLGFFHKALSADCLVLLDCVQYRKRYFQNRNRIRGKTQPVWLTVPVLTKGRYEQRMEQVRIDNEGNPRWQKICWKILAQHYTASPYWPQYSGELKELYERPWELLTQLNEEIIRRMFRWFSIDTRIVRSSELAPEGSSSVLLSRLCRGLGARVYLSGISGRDYLDLTPFTQAGIEVRFQEFHHPIYSQQVEPFIPCLSAVDLLMNHGPSSRQILQGVGVPVLEEVFR